jgi:hypothetical protein
MTGIEFAIVMFFIGPTPETSSHTLIADHLTNGVECELMARRLSMNAAWASRPNAPKEVFVCETLYPPVVEEEGKK